MLRRVAIALAAIWFGLALACAQTPNQNLLRMNGGIHPAYYCDYTQGAFCGGESYSTASLRTIVDATGAITSAPNNTLLNNATLSTQSVTVGPQWNYLLSFYGTGSVTLSGAATGTINGTGANNQVYLKVTAPTAGTLTLTVSGSVTQAVLAAVTYETSPRPGDQVVTTSAAYYGPAFDFDPVSHAPLGLRIEGPRTNLFLNSSAPATQTITVVSGSAYSISFYGTGVLTLSGALTQVMTGNAYPARTTYTGTTSTTSLVVTVTSLGTMSYPQVELGGAAGAYATSAIPTGASSVTRASDVVKLVGSALATLNSTSNSSIIETNSVAAITFAYFIDGTSSQELIYVDLPTRIKAYDGAHFLQFVNSNVNIQTSVVRSAIAVNRSGLIFGLGGSSSTLNVYTPTILANAYLGSLSGTSGFIDGHITKLALYNVALSSIALQHNTLLTTRLR